MLPQQSCDFSLKLRSSLRVGKGGQVDGGCIKGLIHQKSLLILDSEEEYLDNFEGVGQQRIMEAEI